jgi:hypothetical protein
MTIPFGHAAAIVPSTTTRPCSIRLHSIEKTAGSGEAESRSRDPGRGEPPIEGKLDRESDFRYK